MSNKIITEEEEKNGDNDDDKWNEGRLFGWIDHNVHTLIQ